MRIVAGSARGRPLEAPAGMDVRPTSDRARQAIFNVLEHGGFSPDGGSPIPGARVLDAFAGSGAMGIEALSRGAAHATFLDTANLSLRTIRQNLAACGFAEQATVMRADATRPPKVAAPADLAFLDPPYHQALAEPALRALALTGWFAEGAIVTLEIGPKDAFAPPDGFTPLNNRKSGKAQIVLLRYGG